MRTVDATSRLDRESRAEYRQRDHRLPRLVECICYGRACKAQVGRSVCDAARVHAEPGRMHEMQTVVRLETHVGDEQVGGMGQELRVRALEGLADADSRDRLQRSFDSVEHASVRLHEENVLTRRGHGRRPLRHPAPRCSTKRQLTVQTGSSLVRQNAPAYNISVRRPQLHSDGPNSHRTHGAAPRWTIGASLARARTCFWRARSSDHQGRHGATPHLKY